MKWSELFNIDQQPSYEDIKEFIGQGEPLWSELLSYIELKYKVHTVNVLHSPVGM
jgi:hypothetical protein